MMLNTHRITQSTFRVLVGAVFFSLFYDLFWFGMISSQYDQDTKYDGGLERNIRKFSLTMAYISFFLRILVALVFWKDSLDYDNIMLGKKESAPAIVVHKERE